MSSSGPRDPRKAPADTRRSLTPIPPSPVEDDGPLVPDGLASGEACRLSP